jgi:hypothetical protein
MKGKGKKFGDFKTRFLLDCTYSRYPYKIEALFLMSETNPYHVRSIINSKSQSFWVTMVDAILNSFRPEIVIERLYMLGLAEPTQNVYHDYSEKWERELKTDFRLVSYIHFRPKSWERYARMLQEFLKHGLSLDLEKNTKHQNIRSISKYCAKWVHDKKDAGEKGFKVLAYAYRSYLTETTLFERLLINLEN